MRITTYETEKTSDHAVKLVKDCAINYQTGEGAIHLDNPGKVAALMSDCFKLDRKAEEYVYMIATDTKLKPVGVFEVSHGTVNSSLITSREVYMRAMLIGAANIFIIHNHPSGEVTPSKEDLQITRTLSEAGKILGISLMDHVIVGNNEYYSFRENGNI